MKKLRRSFVFCILSIIVIVSCLFPATALAKGSASLSLSASETSVNVGDTVTVRITFSSTDEPIGILDAKFQYDSSLLKYHSGGGNAVEISSGTGGISDEGTGDTKTMSYSIRFTALDSGTASFSITQSEVTGLESGATLGTPKKNLSISIGNAAGSTDPNASAEPSESPVEQLYITVDGKSLPLITDEELLTPPKYFSLTTTSYEDVTVPAAIHEASGITLLAAADEQGGVGWYQYIEGRGSCYALSALSFENIYYPVTPDPSLVPSDWIAQQITYEGAQISAWTAPSLPDDVYLIYAMNEKGETHFYLYDTTEETLQRAWIEEKEETPAPSPSPTPTEAPVSSSDATENAIDPLWIILPGAALVAILLIIVVIVGIRYQEACEDLNRKY